MGSHGPRVLPMLPSSMQWHKFKDTFHFFFMLGAIPLGTMVLLVNIFVGPATLTPIPEGYEPKHWEYHRHPISRFISRYIYPSPQQDYEKSCHFRYEEGEKMKIRQLEKMVKAKMAERKDYQAYYYRPMSAKYIRVAKKTADDLTELYGDT